MLQVRDEIIEELCEMGEARAPRAVIRDLIDLWEREHGNGPDDQVAGIVAFKRWLGLWPARQMSGRVYDVVES